MKDKEMIEEVKLEILDCADIKLAYLDDMRISKSKPLSLMHNIFTIDCKKDYILEALGIPKDSVVLSKEEYENIYKQAEQNVLANIADGGTSCDWCIKEHEKIGYEKGSKELEELKESLADSVVLSKEEIAKMLKAEENKIKEYRKIERKETAYNVLDMVDFESNGQTEAITNVLRKKFSTNGINTLSSKETVEKFIDLLTDNGKRQTLPIEDDKGNICDRAYIIPQSHLRQCAESLGAKIKE